MTQRCLLLSAMIGLIGSGGGGSAASAQVMTTELTVTIDVGRSEKHQPTIYSSTGSDRGPSGGSNGSRGGDHHPSPGKWDERLGLGVGTHFEVPSHERLVCMEAADETYRCGMTAVVTAGSCVLIGKKGLACVPPLAKKLMECREDYGLAMACRPSSSERSSFHGAGQGDRPSSIEDTTYEAGSFNAQPNGGSFTPHPHGDLGGKP